MVLDMEINEKQMRDSFCYYCNGSNCGEEREIEGEDNIN